jgi:hypothetical protein
MKKVNGTKKVYIKLIASVDIKCPTCGSITAQGHGIFKPGTGSSSRRLCMACKQKGR